MTGPGTAWGPRLPLRAWLLLSHLLVLGLPLLVVVGTGSLARELHAQTAHDLRNQASLLALVVETELERLRAVEPSASLDDLGPALRPRLVRAREATLAGVRIVDPTGRVVASSGDELGEDLSHRPEVAAALEGSEDLAVRPRGPPSRSQPLDSASRRARVRLFLGVPLHVDGRHVGAIVLSRTPREEVQALYQLVPWWAAALPLLMTVAVALTAGWGFTRSLQGLEVTARALADGRFAAVGDLDGPARSRVSEVGGLAAAFRTMAGRLRERLAYIGEFAGNVSHEFKTPLATLRGTVELLADDAEMPADQRERFLHNAMAEVDRLSELVTGLLALARAEEVVDRAPVDLDALVAGVVAELGVGRVEGRAGSVRGDGRQLRSAVDNLLRNARDHGGDEVVVRLGAEEGVARVQVVDDGPGISEANQARLFDRFFTTRRDRGGTGVGLALVRAVAEGHGGRASVSSAPGRTVFTLVLPR